MNIKETVELGLKHYNNPDGAKFNCCESTLLALSTFLEIEDNNIPAIATPFGGGIGGCGKTCGCLTAAAMAIGFKCGRSSCEESKDPATDAVRELMDLFEEKYKTTDCKDLIGMRTRDHELSNEDKNKLHEEICNGILSDTISWTAKILDK